MIRTTVLLTFLAVLLFSCEKEKNPVQTPPTAPNLLAAIEISYTTIHLTWNDRASTEDGYELEVMVNNQWQHYADFDVNTTDALVEDLTPNTTYGFRVFAYNSAGRSDASNVVSVSTLPLNTPPAPTHVGANALSAFIVRVTWNDTAPNPVIFVIDRHGATGEWTTVGEAPDNATSFNDSTCTPETQYYYRVGARAGALVTWSEDSAEVVTPQIGAPNPPSNLQAQVILGTGVHLTWVDNSLEETSFEIGRNISGQPFGVLDTVPANTTEYFDTLGSANAVYNYGVRAVNSVGTSGWSNYATAEYIFCSDGAVPICFGNYWTYEVNPPDGPNYLITRRIARADFVTDIDYYLIVEDSANSGVTDTLFYWRNFDDGLYQDAYPFDAQPAGLLLRVPAASGFWTFNSDSVIVTTSNLTVNIQGTIFTGVTIYQRFIRGTNQSIKYYLKPTTLGIIKEEDIVGGSVQTTREIVDWEIRN